jgi:hypothetical protein
MAACTFCGSKDIRLSGSSTLDTPGARLRRALTLRRLYRCRSCDALFEAIALVSLVKGSKRGGSESRPRSRPRQPGSTDSEVSSQRLVGGSGSTELLRRSSQRAAS